MADLPIDDSGQLSVKRCVWGSSSSGFWLYFPGGSYMCDEKQNEH